MPPLLFAIALVIGLLAELADHVGWPATILIMVAAVAAVVRACTRPLKSGPSTAIPGSGPGLLPTLPDHVPEAHRCTNCGKLATHKSPDIPFLWCEACRGPDDRLLVRFEGAKVASYAACRFCGKLATRQSLDGKESWCWQHSEPEYVPVYTHLEKKPEPRVKSNDEIAEAVRQNLGRYGNLRPRSRYRGGTD